jgi:Ca2+-binding RTX toxin-like protein
MATIDGTSGNDYLPGTAAADVLNGLAGDDTLWGGVDGDAPDGADTLDGGDGTDQLWGDNGDDALFGGAGHDLLTGDDGNDILVGGAGNDWLHGGYDDGADQLFGDAGADTLIGNDSDDFLVGGSGADVLEGGWGSDTLRGGAGDDVLDWFWSPEEGQKDRISGGGGVDRVELWSGTIDSNTVDLTALPNGLITDVEIIDLSEYRYSELQLILSRSDLLDLSSTTNSLKVLGDADDSLSIVGDFQYLGVSGAFRRYKLGAGTLLVDTDIPQVYAPTVINGSGGKDILDGTPGDDLLVGEGGDDLLDAGAAHDTLDGGDGNDALYGGSHYDALDGGDGDDRLDGGAGKDTLSGGHGNDTYVMRATAPTEENNRTFWDADLVFDAGGRDKLIFIDQGGELPEGVENLLLKGSATPTWWNRLAAYGNDLDNVIRSEVTGPYTHVLDGRGGDDTLIGSDGLGDYFSFSGPEGDYGDDYVDGRDGIDWLYVSGVVDFRTGTMTSDGESGSGSVRFKNVENAISHGNSDLLIANDRGTTFHGGGGDDTLVGGAGNDFLDADIALMGEDYRPQSGNDSLIGGAGADTLRGWYAEDILDGGSGADVLEGGWGADTLQGGRGNDLLEWYASSEERDRVDGGLGDDRLIVRNGSLDLTKVPNKSISNIEVIELYEEPWYVNVQDLRQTLTLNEADLLDISSTTDTLTVLGKREDSVDIVGPYEDLGVADGFHRYSLGAGTLLVDTDITNVA